MKERVEISVPFNSKRKVFPNGDIQIKKYNFTSFRIEEGYEECERLNSKTKALQVESRGETYASFVRDFKDRKRIRDYELLHSVPKDTDDEKDVPIAIVYYPEDVRLNISEELREERKLKKVLYNIAKTRDKIFDIACANTFNYFITLTYSSEKCDRYSFQECSKKVRQFMNNFKKEHRFDCPNFKYLLVHEQHKNGAYHYHGLIYLEDVSTLSLALHQPKSCKYPVYNWGRWKNGFSTVTEINDINATRAYILKYINKNIDESYVKGQRHFYYSQNCEKPEISYDMIKDEQLLAIYNEVYSTDRSKGYEGTLEEEKEMKDLICEFRYGI